MKEIQAQSRTNSQPSVPITRRHRIKLKRANDGLMKTMPLLKECTFRSFKFHHTHTQNISQKLTLRRLTELRRKVPSQSETMEFRYFGSCHRN